jgi:hypothetical protein
MATPRKEHVTPSALLEMEARLLSLYRRASKADVVEGTAWYRRANEYAQSLAAGTPWTADTMAAVISAISPRMPWGRNQKVARDIVDRFTAGGREADYTGLGLTDNIRLAVIILAGVNPDRVLVNKRAAFRANIAGDLTRATVDIWATRAAMGTDEFEGPGRYYAELESVYQRAADAVGLSAAQFQAVIWIVIRRETLGEVATARLDRIA